MLTRNDCPINDLTLEANLDSFQVHLERSSLRKVYKSSFRMSAFEEKDKHNIEIAHIDIFNLIKSRQHKVLGIGKNHAVSRYVTLRATLEPTLDNSH